MFHLSEFLKRFQNFGLNERLSKELLIESVNETLKKPLLKLEDVSIQNHVAKLKVPTVLKSELFMRKETILNNARQKGGSSFVITDIR